MTLHSRRIERICPKLLNMHYERDSLPDKNYNCIAYAAGDLWAWWDHNEYWPPSACRRGEKLADLIAAFEAVGFQDCRMDFSLEVGFDKVALYQTVQGNWTHAARLRPDGWWESKFGNWDDMLHKSPHIEGLYGTVGCVMKRTLLESAKARVAARRRARQNNKW